MSTATSTKTPAGKLNAKLAAGIVTFSYKKKDGSVRYAVGTTVSSLMPADKAPKTAGTATDTPTTQRYYDFMSQDWRTVTKTEVMRIHATVVK